MGQLQPLMAKKFVVTYLIRCMKLPSVAETVSNETTCVC